MDLNAISQSHIHIHNRQQKSFQPSPFKIPENPPISHSNQNIKLK